MKEFSLVTLLLFFTVLTDAQSKLTTRVDSMRTVLERSQKEDSNTVKTYYELATELNKTDPAKAMLVADSGIVLGKRVGWAKGIAFMNIAKGNIIGDKGHGTDAIPLYEEAYAISEEAGDRSTMAKALNDIGGVYYQRSEYVKALTYYTKSLKIGEEFKDENLIATCYTNFSTIYFNQKNYEKSIEYASKALSHYQKLNDPDKIARALNYMGNTYYGLQDVKKAEEYYTRALKIYEQTGNQTGRAILYSQIAILFDPDYEKIISFQEKSQAIWDSINPGHFNSIINLGNTGETYLNIIRADTLHHLSGMERNRLLDKAASFLNRAIGYARIAHDQDNLSYFSGVLAEQQELKGDYKQAVENYKLHFSIRDSLYSQENKNKIASIESQKEIDLRDKEIELNKLALVNERRQRLAMIGGLVLLLIIGALLYFQSRMRKRSNTTLLQLNNELDEANKVKARFFAILSHDLRSPISNLVSFLELQQEAPGLLDAKETSRHQENIGVAARSLLDNMESMLIWSKGQMETFKPEIRSVAVKEIFDYIEKFFATTSGVRIIFNDPGNLLVSTDENYLQTIMQNLTANAVKALRGRSNATIEWKAMKDGDKTLLSITDNGPGLEEHQVKALYEESAVANTRMGFGLHLIRDLAKAIKCKISIESAPGAGTTFKLSA